MQEEQNQLEELRKVYYEIRKFEIENLWQRSVFLATFSALLFTSYGFLIGDIMLDFDKWSASKEQQKILAHSVCCGVTFLGAIFSIIWIMMAKGSKAWYEIYEGKIYDIERNRFEWEEEFCLSGGVPKSFSRSLWTRGAGPFSVSKINILLGQILLITWMTTLIIHSRLLYQSLHHKYEFTSFKDFVSISLAPSILCLLSCLLEILVGSSSIESPTKKKKENDNQTKKSEEEQEEKATTE